MSPPPHDVEEQGEPKSATHLPDTAAARKARMQALCAKRSLQAKKEHEERKAEDERTTERWSGFRIVDRCIRQEKWDAAMRGKDIVPIQHLGGLLRSRHNKVVIGVLFGIGKPQTNQSCEWKITDLNRESPSEASLIFTGRAFEHWSASKDVKVGQILGILNPELSCRSGAIIVTFETQVVQLGTCPSFAFCQASDDGRRCQRPCHKEGSGYCVLHGKRSHGDRHLVMTQGLSSRKRRRM